MNEPYQTPSVPDEGPESPQQVAPISTETVAPLPPIPERRQEACRVASNVFRKSPDWVTFFREVLGVEGVVHRMFPRDEDRIAFERSAEYQEIQQMVAKLRERSKHQTEGNEPTKVITVRLPKSLHESLRAEAHQKQTSMNQLCISKLLQIIGTDLVPSD